MPAFFTEPYGFSVLAGLALCLVGCIFAWKRKQLQSLSLAAAFPLGTMLGLIGARACYLFSNILSGIELWGSFLSDYPFEYAFCGAVIGITAALWITGLIFRRPFHILADAAAVPLLMLVVVCRLGEFFSDFGWGPVVRSAWAQFPPLAVQDGIWHEWHLAVFNLEALLAAVTIAAVLRRGRKPGRFAAALIWWSMGQIFCETIRSEAIRWGFVPLQQLLAAVFGLAVLLIFAVIGRKKSLPFPWLALILYLAGTGLVAFFEFALDKCPWPAWIDYVGMAATLLMMGSTAVRVVDRTAAYSEETA